MKNRSEPIRRKGAPWLPEFDERMCRNGVLALAGLLLLLGVFFGQCERNDRYISEDKVWKEVKKQAERHGLDPVFVYQIPWAESTLNAHARTDVARGLMQLTEGAWVTVSDRSYRRAWNWRVNIEVGVAYLAHLRDSLEVRDRFSYPLLAASYRYGPGRVRSAEFQLDRLPSTRNRIYQEVFAGRYPVAPPGE